MLSLVQIVVLSLIFGTLFGILVAWMLCRSTDAGSIRERYPLRQLLTLVAGGLFVVYAYCGIIFLFPDREPHTVADEAGPALAEADAGGSGNQEAGKAGAVNAEPEPKVTRAPARKSRKRAAPLGESIISESGWKVRVLSLERNAFQRMQAENMFNEEPGPDQEWVILRLEATYDGDEETGKLTGSEVRLTGDRGVIYSSQGVLESPFEGEAFGGTVEGDLPFLVGKGEGNLIAIFDSGVGSSAWYLAAEEITTPIVEPVEVHPDAAGAGKSRDSAAEGPVLASDGVQLRVLEIDRNAAERVQEENRFNDAPGPGMEYVLVKVEALYFGDKEPSYLSSRWWYMVGEENKIYEKVYLALDDEYDDGTLFQYGKHQGWISFEIPKGEQDLILIYGDSSGVDEDARYLALPEE